MLRIFFALILSCVVITSQAQQMAFYRRISIDDRQCSFSLREKIDSTIARKTDCYRVMFDKLNRIKCISFEKCGRVSVGRYQISVLTISYTDSMEIRKYDFPSSGRYSTFSYHLQLNADKVPVAVVYHDKNGKIAKDKDGVACYKRILDDKGQMVECRYFDENDQPVTDVNGDAFFRYEWKSDNAFYKPECYYYGRDGKPNKGKRGYSVVKMTFYKAGEHRAFETAFYDANMKPVCSKANYAVLRSEYFKNGMLKTLLFLDTGGKPVKNDNGVSRIDFEYNEFGNCTTEKQYAGSVSHFVEYSNRYDENQLLVERTRKKDGQKLAGDKENVAITRYEYDSTGRLKAYQTFDKNNKSILRTAY